MKELTLEQMLEAELAEGLLLIGQVAVRAMEDNRFEVAHRDTGLSSAEELAAEQALEMAKFDDDGNYRPLRTAPTLRRGWTIAVANISELIAVIDTIYPARLAAWHAWKLGRLTVTPLRETLNRQSGMYRVAAKISDEQLDDLVGNFCRSDGGCLRTILWRRDQAGQIPSTKLARRKFDPAVDQTGRGEKVMPLLCQEGCNLLVAACRNVVKSGEASRSRHLL